MKFHGRKTYAGRCFEVRAKEDKYCKWHLWFAWYPVCINKRKGDNRHLYAWLEFVERFGTNKYWNDNRVKFSWQYRGHGVIK